MAFLDIIITHCREPWADCRKMFEMLRMQRGICDGDFRVILVQDGESDTLDLPRILKVYPFVECVSEIPKSGVSAARNRGLAIAESEWVMFCDCDDCFWAVDSVHDLIDCLRQAGDQADLVWSPFWMEFATESGAYRKALKGRNRIFIHGKAWRREFLVGHRLQFDTELDYSEDALFNEIADMELNAERVARIDKPLYVWTLRHGSLSNYKGGEAKRNLHLYKKRLKTIEEQIRHMFDYDAKCQAARTVLEYYWDLNLPGELAGRTKEEWEKRIREDVVAKFPRAFYETRADDQQKIWRVLMLDAERTRKTLRAAELKMGVAQWLCHMGAIRKASDWRGGSVEEWIRRLETERKETERK